VSHNSGGGHGAPRTFCQRLYFSSPFFCRFKKASMTLQSTCVLSIVLKLSNGEEQRIERKNGKFTCSCGTSITRTDHFRSHWEECQNQG
jgi:hypothetical protein